MNFCNSAVDHKYAVNLRTLEDNGLVFAVFNTRFFAVYQLKKFQIAFFENRAVVYMACKATINFVIHSAWLKMYKHFYFAKFSDSTDNFSDLRHIKGSFNFYLSWI